MTALILCTDGSDLALGALTEGLSLLRPGLEPVIVTVVEAPNMSLVAGSSGMAGGSMSASEFDTLTEETRAAGEQIVAETATKLGLERAETRVLEGHAGTALCALAADLSAGAIVMGSRGRGGLTRALLGSASDYVVRNAPCSVLITRAPSGS
jgi:nucleotide-binding universal stress UspA family protein